jgi:hypothetical protein
MLGVSGLGDLPQEIVSWIQNPDIDADLYAMFSAVAAPTAYFAAQL